MRLEAFGRTVQKPVKRGEEAAPESGGAVLQVSVPSAGWEEEEGRRNDWVNKKNNSHCPGVILAQSKSLGDFSIFGVPLNLSLVCLQTVGH